MNITKLNAINSTLVLVITFGSVIVLGIIGAIVEKPITQPTNPNGINTIDQTAIFGYPIIGLDYLHKLIDQSYTGTQVKMCLGC